MEEPIEKVKKEYRHCEDLLSKREHKLKERGIDERYWMEDEVCIRIHGHLDGMLLVLDILGFESVRHELEGEIPEQCDIDVESIMMDIMLRHKIEEA